MMRLPIGQRVKVTEGSGLDSGRIGTVIATQRLPRNGRGIPLLPGYYRPLNTDDIAVIDDSGHMFTMVRNRLIVR